MSESYNPETLKMVVINTLDPPSSHDQKVKFQPEQTIALIRHNKNGCIRLRDGRDKILLQGESLLLSGQIPSDGEAPYWLEREPDIVTLKHGTGNIRFADGKDRQLIEGEADISFVSRVDESGQSYFEEVESKATVEPSEQQTFYSLEHHPEYRDAIARMALAYARIEFSVATIFTWMMQAPPEHASSAYHTLKNNRTRLELIRSLEQWLHSDGEKIFVSTALSIIVEAATIRNKYCHSVWKLVGDQPSIIEHVASRFPSGYHRPISLTEIQSSAATIERAQKVIAAVSDGLVVIRPVKIVAEALKPSYARKYQKQSARPDRSVDPKPPQTDENA